MVVWIHDYMFNKEYCDASLHSIKYIRSTVQGQQPPVITFQSLAVTLVLSRNAVLVSLQAYHT